MDEQRVREIVREELAAAATTANTIALEKLAEEIFKLQQISNSRKSHIPSNPWD